MKITIKHLMPLFTGSILRPKEAYASILKSNLHALSEHLSDPLGTALRHLISSLAAGERPVPTRPGAAPAALWTELFSDQSLAHKFDECAHWLSGEIKVDVYQRYAAQLAELHSTGNKPEAVKAVSEMLAFSMRVESSLPRWIAGGDAVLDMASRRSESRRNHLPLPFSAMHQDGVFAPEGLTTVGAYPGAGKTALLTTLMMHAARSGKKAAYLVLEDDRDAIIDRIASTHAGLAVGKIRTGALTAAEFGRLQDAYAQTHTELERAWFPDDISRRLTPEAVESLCREAIERHGAEVLFLDHIGEIDVTSSERHDLGIDRIAGALVSIGTTYHVPVIVAAHLRRKQGADVDSIPQLQDFAFSSSLERKSHLALGLWQANGQVGCKVLKQRSGPSGMKYALTWRQPGCTFMDECERMVEEEDHGNVRKMRDFR